MIFAVHLGATFSERQFCRKRLLFLREYAFMSSLQYALPDGSNSIMLRSVDKMNGRTMLTE